MALFRITKNSKATKHIVQKIGITK